MTDMLAHRGPDGRGVREFTSDGLPAALGHRRLSIIDPTPRGAQPMSDASGRYWITFNGEIYNYRELHDELRAAGQTFSSDCDTEVLLALYAHHGPAMLNVINGMYAFAIWDTERRELFIARDRLGVKPLYYSLEGGVLAFASEIKALLVDRPAPSIRHDALPDYLTFLWVPDPDTLFEGIYKLPPGHFARFSGEELEISQYWDVAFDVEAEPSSSEWFERLRVSVQEAVHRQMVSDVPIGAFLSGGLDSGAVVATMREHLDQVSTYTVGFDPKDLAHEPVPDDLRYARMLGAELGVDYNERILTPSIVELLPKLVWHMDEPVADPAAITTYLICQAAREQMTVILSGMGADEVFAGYPRYLAARLGRIAHQAPASIARGAQRLLDGRVTMGPPGRLRTPRRNLLKMLGGIDQPSGIDRHLTYTSYYREAELRALLSEDLLAELDGVDPLRSHRGYAERVADEDWLNQLLYIDQKTFLPCLNLTYTDKMSMAASTEVRVPLLDDEVVALAGKVPPGLKLHGRHRKYVLKKSMEGVLPESVIWRPKAGFGVPLRAWMANDLKPMVDDLLSPETVAGRGLFDPVAVRALIDDNDAGRADNSLRIWALLVLEIWQQTFTDGSSSPSEMPISGSRS